jgi:hypothetical protein
MNMLLYITSISSIECQAGLGTQFSPHTPVLALLNNNMFSQFPTAAVPYPFVAGFLNGAWPNRIDINLQGDGTPTGPPSPFGFQIFNVNQSRVVNYKVRGATIQLDQSLGGFLNAVCPLPPAYAAINPKLPPTGAGYYPAENDATPNYDGLSRSMAYDVSLLSGISGGVPDTIAYNTQPKFVETKTVIKSLGAQNPIKVFANNSVYSERTHFWRFTRQGLDVLGSVFSLGTSASVVTVPAVTPYASLSTLTAVAPLSVTRIMIRYEIEIDDQLGIAFPGTDKTRDYWVCNPFGRVSSPSFMDMPNTFPAYLHLENVNGNPGFILSRQAECIALSKILASPAGEPGGGFTVAAELNQGLSTNGAVIPATLIYGNIASLTDTLR